MQFLPSGIQEVRACFFSMGFSLCITTKDGKHFPTFSSHSEEWCITSRKPYISRVFQRITTVIRASTCRTQRPERCCLSRLGLSGACPEQASRITSSLLFLGKWHVLIFFPQSHSPPMPILCFAHHPSSCHLAVENMSSLGT